MIELTVGNSFSKITGLTTAQFMSIREKLCYTLPAAQAYYLGWRNSPKRYLIDARGGFPSGLLKTVQDWLLDNQAYYTLTDTRKRPIGETGRFKLVLPHTPYELQLEAVETAYKLDRGTISACTGFGKSIIIALLVQKFQLKTLIVVPNLTLKNQVSESFKQYFGSLDNITIHNIDSPELDKLNDYDILIIDEAHHVAAATYRKLNKHRWSNIYHRFYLTATPFRSRDEENILMESVAGQVIYSVTYKQALELRAVVPVEAYYYELPKVKTQADTWPGVYKSLIVDRKDRNELVANIIKHLQAADSCNLCLVKEVAHGQKIQELTAAHFAHGENEESSKLIALAGAGLIKTLIGTEGVLGEGVDTRATEYVIIAGLGKSKPALMQKIGRAIRRYPGKDSAKIILFYDPSHKWCKAHFKEQVKVLKEEYGCEPIKLDYC